MGILTYGANSEFEFDDRLLAHLKVVITAKLRRNEGFLLNWKVSAGVGSGRVSLWLGPTIPLQFTFFGSRDPQLNRAWIDVLADLSHSARGLVVISEADAEAVKAGSIALDELEGLTL